MAANAMDEDDARSRRAAPPGNLDQARHSNAVSAENNSQTIYGNLDRSL
jgi:hypothetical protein